MTAVWIIGTLVAAYLIGSIPFGLIFGYLLKGVDIRQHGSRNIGATNAARVIGWKWFPVVVFLDAMKGAGPCIAGQLLMDRAGADLVLFAAFGAFFGHFYSVYIGFKGGKGVATGLGVVLVITAVPPVGLPIPALLGLCVFVLTLLVTRYMSVASFVAALSMPAFYVAWLGDQVRGDPYMWRFLFLVGVALLIVFKHRANIGRIRRGEEPQIRRKAREAA
jgi:glycerol-3-phosphate acyltransferase PlsY